MKSRDVGIKFEFNPFLRSMKTRHVGIKFEFNPFLNSIPSFFWIRFSASSSGLEQPVAAYTVRFSSSQKPLNIIFDIELARANALGCWQGLARGKSRSVQERIKGYSDNCVAASVGASICDKCQMSGKLEQQLRTCKVHAQQLVLPSTSRPCGATTFHFGQPMQAKVLILSLTYQVPHLVGMQSFGNLLARTVSNGTALSHNCLFIRFFKLPCQGWENSTFTTSRLKGNRPRTKRIHL